MMRVAGPVERRGRERALRQFAIADGFGKPLAQRPGGWFSIPRCSSRFRMTRGAWSRMAGKFLISSIDKG